MSDNRMIGIFGMTPISILAHTTGNELKAYIALASFQGNSETSWPSLEQIAKRASLSVQATSEAITGLVKKQLATRKRNYGKTNTYKVLVPTKEAEDSYPENPDNQTKSDNQENPDVDHPEKSSDGYPEKSDDIGKEHIKITKENKRENSTLAKEPDRIPKTDPYFPQASNNEGDIVMNVIQEHLDKHYDMTAVNPLQRREARMIWDRLRGDDKIEKLRKLLNLYTFGEGHESNKFFTKGTPTPFLLLKAIDSLANLRLPQWFEKGFASQGDYEADLIRNKPASHSAITDLKDQFFSGPVVSQERADKFMLEMDELKVKINGKT